MASCTKNPPLQVTPLATLGGIHELHERKWAQVEIFHTGYRKGYVLFQKALQTATCCNDIEPWHLLVKIAQQAYGSRLFLDLVDK